MTRREEIEKVAMEYAAPMTEEDEMLKYEAFKSGAKWADANPVHYDGKAYLYVLHKGVEQGKKEMLEEVCKYIKENLYHAWVNTNNGNTYKTQSTELFIKNLKKAMEDKE